MRFLQRKGHDAILFAFFLRNISHYGVSNKQRLAGRSSIRSDNRIKLVNVRRFINLRFAFYKEQLVACIYDNIDLIFVDIGFKWKTTIHVYVATYLSLPTSSPNAFIANRYDQFGIRANLDFKLSQYVSLTYGNTSRYEYTQYPAKSAGSIFSAIRRSKPTLNAYWPSGEIGPDIEFGDNPAATSTDAAGYNRQKNYYIQNNATLTIQFPWVEGLKLTASGAYDKHFYGEKNFRKPVRLYSWDGVTRSSEGLKPYDVWISDPQLNQIRREIGRASCRERV